MFLIFLDLCSSLESPTPCFCLNLSSFYFCVVVRGVKKYLFDLLLKVDDKLDLLQWTWIWESIFFYIKVRREGEGRVGAGGRWEMNNTWSNKLKITKRKLYSIWLWISILFLYLIKYCWLRGYDIRKGGRYKYSNFFLGI